MLTFITFVVFVPILGSALLLGLLLIIVFQEMLCVATISSHERESEVKEEQLQGISSDGRFEVTN